MRSGYLDSFDVEVTERDATLLVPLILSALCAVPRRLVDLGGGTGIWSREFLRQGVSEVHCIDHPSVVERGLAIERSSFHAFDLAVGLPEPVTADLALCLEVAEHIPAARSEDLVDFLTRAADVVVFSAAVPGQGGAGHVNEQHPEYWRRLFAAHGYEPIDALRPRALSNPAISYWYRQNLVFYASEAGRSEIVGTPGSYTEIPPEFILIHNSVYERWCAPQHRGVRVLLRELVFALTSAVRWRAPRTRTPGR